jgi:hypothetical protein
METKRKEKHKRLFQMRKLINNLIKEINKSKYLETTDIKICLENIIRRY